MLFLNRIIAPLYDEISRNLPLPHNTGQSFTAIYKAQGELLRCPSYLSDLISHPASSYLLCFGHISLLAVFLYPRAFPPQGLCTCCDMNHHHLDTHTFISRVPSDFCLIVLKNFPEHLFLPFISFLAFIHMCHFSIKYSCLPC